MQTITTDKTKGKKKVLVDGYEYMVRRPGAGESLTFNQLGRELKKLERKPKFTAAEQDRYESQSTRALEICLSLFDSLGNKKAERYIQTLDLEVLMETIAQIHGDEDAQSADTDG